MKLVTNRLLANLLLGALAVSHVYADDEHGHGGSTNIVFNEKSASSLGEAFSEGALEGSLSTSFLYSDGTEPDSKEQYGFSRLILNYQTAAMSGIRFGFGATAYVGYERNLEENKFQLRSDEDGIYRFDTDYFLFHNLYLSSISDSGTGFVIGRYEIDSEWITDYTEGATFIYNDFEDVSLEFTWSRVKSELDEFEVLKFGRFLPADTNIGAFLATATFHIHSAELELMPYIYYADKSFIASGLKINKFFDISDSIHLDSFVHGLGYRDMSGDQEKSSQVGLSLIGGGNVHISDVFEVNGGVVLNNSNGAPDILSLGDQTGLETPDRMFDGGAISPYVGFEVGLGDVASAGFAIRYTTFSSSSENFLSSQLILDAEPFEFLSLGAVFEYINERTQDDDSVLTNNRGTVAKVFVAYNF